MSGDDAGVIVGIGASAGGVEALLDLVAGLPEDFPAALLVVLHLSPSAPTVLQTLLARRCVLPVDQARDGESLECGRVYVAPPDHHLMVHAGRVVVSRGPKENGHRPAVDPMLRSLAVEAGPAAIGVVLSGMLDDGAAGLLGIVRHGGTAVVQDPADAHFPGMPEAALHQVPGAVVRQAAELGGTLTELATRPVVGGRGVTRRLAWEVAVARNEAGPLAVEDPPGIPAGLSCPDCSGPLFDLGEADLLHYRCRVGHAWSEANLRAVQDSNVENAVYTALQALEEKASLQHRIAASAEARGSERVASRARASAHTAMHSAALVRGLLSEPRDGEEL